MNCVTERLALNTGDFSPKVLKSYLFAQGTNYPEGYRLPHRYVYDYEFEFFISKGTMVIGDKTYQINPGDIVFRKPGQFTQGIMPYSCYAICFDLLGNTGKSTDVYDFHSVQDFQNNYANPILDAIPPVFHPPFEEEYRVLFDNVLKEFINPDETSEIIMKSCVLSIIQQLYRDVRNPFSGNRPSSAHHVVTKRVIDYIKFNYDEKINLKRLSELANMSPNHFHKVFTSTKGVTPNEFITKTRLDKARELLARTDLTVSEIAMQCGFENIPYFSYIFKKNLNLTPMDFRKKHSYI